MKKREVIYVMECAAKEAAHAAQMMAGWFDGETPTEIVGREAQWHVAHSVALQAERTLKRAAEMTMLDADPHLWVLTARSALPYVAAAVFLWQCASSMRLPSCRADWFAAFDDDV